MSILAVNIILWCAVAACVALAIACVVAAIGLVADIFGDLI